jgi:hypothetical protein
VVYPAPTLLTSVLQHPSKLMQLTTFRFCRPSSVQVVHRIYTRTVALVHRGYRLNLLVPIKRDILKEMPCINLAHHPNSSGSHEQSFG